MWGAEAGFQGVKGGFVAIFTEASLRLEHRQSQTPDHSSVCDQPESHRYAGFDRLILV